MTAAAAAAALLRLSAVNNGLGKLIGKVPQLIER